METSAPSLPKILTMVLFALSCVGLLLFLWLSFGGKVPFNPQGYEVRISFANAGQLAQEADVRIAGVSVGKVISKSLDPKGNRTIATIQLANQYAPLHRDAQAILRTKTIIGETYVEITPGSPNAPPIPDGGLLSRSNVQPAVQLSDIYGAFDEPTRKAFQQWQQQFAVAVKGNDQNLNDTLGNLPTFVADATDILRVLDVEHNAVQGLVRNGSTVFAALSQDQSALRGLITSAHTTFTTTAQQNKALSDTFHVFPTFLDETKATMARLQTFATDTDPLIKELLPVAHDLGPTLHSVKVLSPDLEHFFVNLGPLITAAKTGLPAYRDVIRGATPLLGALGPFLEQLNPILSWLSVHQQLISDFISNGAAGIAATTKSFSGDGVGHYLRQFAPVGPETLSFAPQRDPNNRGNTYPPPLWLANAQNLIKGNFPSWDCANTGASGNGSTPGSTSTNTPACWVAPPLPGAKPGKIPAITQAQYSSK
ncbi:MAG TPA: MlaD family protein [Solirubrobacteraceae bacterium]|nr:MlaD family protein [Solirubrobacteraceae bacterium]